MADGPAGAKRWWPRRLSQRAAGGLTLMWAVLLALTATGMVGRGAPSGIQWATVVLQTAAFGGYLAAWLHLRRASTAQRVDRAG